MNARRACFTFELALVLIMVILLIFVLSTRKAGASNEHLYYLPNTSRYPVTLRVDPGQGELPEAVMQVKVFAFRCTSVWVELQFDRDGFGYSQEGNECIDGVAMVTVRIPYQVKILQVRATAFYLGYAWPMAGYLMGEWWTMTP